MKNFVKENWFKIGILILGSIFIIGQLFIQWREIRIKKFQAEFQTFNSIINMNEDWAKSLFGKKEYINFKQSFWDFYNK